MPKLPAADILSSEDGEWSTIPSTWPISCAVVLARSFTRKGGVLVVATRQLDFRIHDELVGEGELGNAH